MDTMYKKYEPIFNKYYIKESLGEGSFGKVYLIEWESYGKKYEAALKVITVPKSKTDLEHSLSYMTPTNAREYYEDIVNDIVNEFHLMSKLKGHSHIVSYEDHEVIPHGDEIGWDILIRMELLTPLKKHADLQKISRHEVIRLGIDLCKALEKCQSEDIIHRDIKPENIFVSADNTYKLGDFGVARTIEKTTGSFTQIGTPPYMAPEIHTGEKYSSCIDIYSLGLTMYRLLNKNRMPFLPAYPATIETGDEEIAISKRINGNKMPPPADADKKLAEIVLKACAHNPQDRYQKPSQMREDLEAVQYEKETVPGNPPEVNKSNEHESSSGSAPVPEKHRMKRGVQGTMKMFSAEVEEEVTLSVRPPSNPPPHPPSHLSQPPSKAKGKKAKIGYTICTCGAEIRRESISCISCRKQLRRV